MKSPKATEQLPLAFQHVSASGRDDLLISDPLNAAVTVVDAWPNWPSPVVILAGPIGSGKSHLAAIWQQKSGASEIHPIEGGGAEEAAAAGPVLFSILFPSPSYLAVNIVPSGRSTSFNWFSLSKMYAVCSSVALSLFPVWFPSAS